jgi:hypothetical protein
MRAALLLVVAAVVATPGIASAHCDTMDGPVVIAGKRALDSGELAHASIWIDAAVEGELREAFAAAREVRRGTPRARAVADRWFLETLVRLHRAGEGEPYAGLRPAGAGATPAIAAADHAVESGKLQPVVELITHAVHARLEDRFAPLRRPRAAATDVAAGRAWVKAYVAFMHTVEGLHAAAGGDAHQAPAAHAH